MTRMWAGLALLGLLGSGVQAAPPGKQREAFVKDLTRAAAGIDARVKGKVIALLDFRPETLKEGEDNSVTLSASRLMQDQLYQALLVRGIMTFAVERERPLTVKRNRSGNMAKGLFFSNEDVKYFREKRKADYALEGRLSRGAGSIFSKNASPAFTLKLRLIDLKTGRVIPAYRFAKVDPKDTPIEEVLAGELLPKLNRIVLEFAMAHIGEQVDRGECWDVPAVPLRKAGSGPAAYNFGTPVSWKDALPGDVVTSDTHVMVLVKPTKEGKGSKILHQNVNNKRFVIYDDIYSPAGLTVWRPGKPNPKFGNGKNLK